MPAVPAIAPISRNIGMAERSQLAANTNGASESAPNATLMLRRYQNPAKATAPMATPIGSRSAISTSMAPRLTRESVSVLISALLPLTRLRPAADVDDEAGCHVDQHDRGRDRQDPAAGIGRNVH